MTDGGDCRVRATRDSTSGEVERNIATLYWQPANQRFRCRILETPPGLLANMNGIVELRQVQNPLPNEFKFELSQAINERSFLINVAELISLIDYAIARYRL